MEAVEGMEAERNRGNLGQNEIHEVWPFPSWASRPSRCGEVCDGRRRAATRLVFM